MSSFRAKPIGWRGESYRHYLAAKGFKTKAFGREFEFQRDVDLPDRQIGPTVRVQTGRHAGDALLRVQVGERVEPVMRPSDVTRFQSSLDDPLKKQEVKKALEQLPVSDRGRVFDRGRLRRLVGKVKEKVRFEDLRPVDKGEIEDEFLPIEPFEERGVSAKAIDILEAKGQLTRDKEGKLDEESLRRVRVLMAADDPLGTEDEEARRQLAVVMSKLDDPERPQIERKPYAEVLGELVERIETGAVTSRGPRAKVLLQRVLRAKLQPEFTTLVGTEKPADVSAKVWKEIVQKQKDFFDRQKAIKELEAV